MAAPGSIVGTRIGHLARRVHQIAPPEFDAIDAEVARRQFEQPLAEEIRLDSGPARDRCPDGVLLVTSDRDIEVDMFGMRYGPAMNCATLRAAITPFVRI